MGQINHKMFLYCKNRIQKQISSVHKQGTKKKYTRPRLSDKLFLWAIHPSLFPTVSQNEQYSLGYSMKSATQASKSVVSILLNINSGSM